MKYQGGKAKQIKQMAPVIIKIMEDKGHQTFYDLFCGACNVVAAIPNSYERFANDIRPFMVATMSVDSVDIFPDYVDKLAYYILKNNLPKDDPIYGFVSVGCGYSGQYGQGYGTINDARRAKSKLAKTLPLLKDVKWSVGSYDKVNIKPNSLVYCDPPYWGTKGYRTNFNHQEFYEWVEALDPSITVLISEYQGCYNPLDLPVIWQKERVVTIGNKKETQKEKEIMMAYNLS